MDVPAVFEVEWSSYAAASIIALYAMMGGALLAAAITAPRNCRIVLQAIIKPIAYALLMVVCFGGGIAPLFGFTSPTALAILKVSDWVAVANLSVFGIYLLCKLIVDRLLQHEEDRGRDRQ
ncbi:hypothetical protein [uncultured Sphingomonas sp.]|uniref:hypothetical protein n=1 Tax=uncultured Sphingomonas sp. TaxID=158754 RepID=UPI0025EBE37A|nr:hypothetical protein [uncultured Sphingomonas sp.]